LRFAFNPWRGTGYTGRNPERNKAFIRAIKNYQAIAGSGRGCPHQRPGFIRATLHFLFKEGINNSSTLALSLFYHFWQIHRKNSLRIHWQDSGTVGCLYSQKSSCVKVPHPVCGAIPCRKESSNERVCHRRGGRIRHTKTRFESVKSQNASRDITYRTKSHEASFVKIPDGLLRRRSLHVNRSIERR
jgi:hypothetical protein